MKRFVAICVWIAVSMPLGLLAQQPRDFCMPGGGTTCTEDSLQVQFLDEAGNLLGSEVSAGMGDTIRVALTMSVRTGGIQGWSLAVTHDPEFLQIVADSWNKGNSDQGLADWTSGKGGPFSGGFANNSEAFRMGAANQGFTQAVVLTFGAPGIELPTGRDNYLLAFADYTVTKDIPEGQSTLITVSDGEVAADARPTAPVVELLFTVKRMDGSTESTKPSQVTDGAVKSDIVPVDCPNWAFIFGTDTKLANLNAGANSFPISIRNQTDSQGFEFAVRNNNNNLSFVDRQIGDGQDNLRELIITDNDAVPHAPDLTNTATISDTITDVVRATATAEMAGNMDFFASQTAPLVGGPGFFVGYVSSFNDPNDPGVPAPYMIPATAAVEPCPVNEVAQVVIGGEVQFSRGDCNGDRRINVTDVVICVRNIFGQGPVLFNCRDMLDVNNDGEANVVDPLFLAEWIFRRGPRPPAPFLECGTDDTTVLGCEQSNCQ